MKKTMILCHGDELLIQSDSFSYLLCNIFGHVAVCRIFTFESIRECLLLHVFACIARVNSFNFECFCFFICRIKRLVLSAALLLPPPRSSRIADVTCFLNYPISTLLKFYPQVCQRNVTRVSAFCHKLRSDVRINKSRHHLFILFSLSTVQVCLFSCVGLIYMLIELNILNKTSFPM